MKKINRKNLFLCLFALFIGLALSGCQNPFLQLGNSQQAYPGLASPHGEAEAAFYTVSFVTKWGGTVPKITGIAKGNAIEEPDPLFRAHFLVEGWYSDAAFTDKWDFANSKVNSNVTLHAKWEFDGIQGDGSSVDPFLVYDVDTLEAVGRGIMVSKGQLWNLDKCYEQIDDVDMEGADNWVPIGSTSTPFIGTYNGARYDILNLSCISSSTRAGLFSVIGYSVGVVAKIKNISLVNAYIEGTDIVGGIAGWCERYSSVTNCSISGTVKGGSLIGGIFGYSMGSVDNSWTSCDVICTGIYVGGISGVQSTSAVRNCYSTGNISGDNYVGGIVGNGSKIIDSTLVQNCYAVGTVSGNQFVGGIMGSEASPAGDGEIVNCVALNPRIDNALSDVGRICGRDIVFTNNYALSGMLGNVSAGTLGDRNGQDITSAEYNNETWWKTPATWSAGNAWDFAGTWKWDEGKKLPVLAWEAID